MHDLDALASLYLFDRVPRDDLAAFLQDTHRQRLAAGQVIFQEGDVADRALLVVSGRLEAVLGGDTLGDIRPGEIVGETALFVPGGRRQATVRAATEAICLILRPNNLLSGRTNPAVIALQRHLIGTMGRRIRTTNGLLRRQWKAVHQPAAPPPPPTLTERLRSLFGGAR